MYDIVYDRLANAADVIVVMAFIILSLGVVVRVLWKKIEAKDKDILAVTAAHALAMAKEKELAKVQDIKNLEAVAANTAAMVQVSTMFNELRNDLKDIKNGN